MIRSILSLISQFKTKHGISAKSSAFIHLECGTTQSFDIGFWPVELHGILDEQVRHCRKCTAKA